jgi:excisionase family DNA binding protein
MATTAISGRFLTYLSAAEMTGVSVETLRRWVREGRIASYRPSRRPLLDAEELTAFIRSFRKGA